MTHVITRFAPSPTGLMTLGNYRTALRSYLFAKHSNGKLLLRIEDTDRARSTEECTLQIKQDLDAMGIDYDKHTILVQSERTSIYQDFFKKLKDDGVLYPCFCSKEDLDIERKLQSARGIAPRYSGRCRSLTQQEIAEKIQQGDNPVLRFRVPNEKISFVDLVMGHKEFDGQDIGDFVVKKNDGTPTFFFCNAIDDALSGVTHVLRGDDHLTNTPRQLFILKALQLRFPFYGHFSMILGFDHKPLSKRTGSRSIKEMLQEGYEPDAINNYLARLGHFYPQQGEILSLDQLAEGFSFDHLSRSPSHFDAKEMDWWQKLVFHKISPEKLMHSLPFEFHQELGDKTEEFIRLVQPNILKLSDMKEWIPLLTSVSHPLSVDIFKEHEWTKEHLSFLSQLWESHSSWDKIIESLKNKGLKGKNLFKPLRYLMSGREDGPKLDDLYHFVSSSVVIHRLSELSREF